MAPGYSIPSHLPILSLPPSSILFPNSVLSIQVANKHSIKLLQSLLQESERGTGTKALILGVVPLRVSKALVLADKDSKAIPDQDASSLPDDKARALVADRLPSVEELFEFGTAARILRLERVSTGGFLVVVEGLARIHIDQFTTAGVPFYEAKITVLPAESLPSADSVLVTTLQTIATRLLVTLSNVAPLTPLLARRLKAFVNAASETSAGPLIDILLASLPPSTGIAFEDKLTALATSPVAERVARGIAVLAQLDESLSLKKKIGDRVDASLSRRQREYLLLQQLAAIREELEAMAKKDPESSLLGRMRKGQPAKAAPSGDADEEEDEDELKELERKIKEKDWSPESGKVALRELKRLKKSPQQGSEYGVIRTYIETLLSLPWNTASPISLSPSFIAQAQAQLDADHYGLEKVKKRLIEWLAVLRLKQEVWEDEVEVAEAANRGRIEELAESSSDDEAATPTEVKAAAIIEKPRDKGPILLLAGPPGCGKTSIAASIASAMGRKFERISLGGVRDESEIRGHRRTYVGALPGAIAMALRRAGVNNPVILLDEIDKLGMSSTHGDPGAALLEVLDPNQNFSFSDHYLGIPLDLSSVIFIATANSLDTISEPLYDRMEVIELSGYVHDEKLQIARRYLLSKQMAANALLPHLLSIEDSVILHCITSYTREAGVRSLERELGSVCRAKAVEYSLARDKAVAAGEKRSSELEVLLKFGYKVEVTKEDLDRILGGEKFEHEALERENMVGVAVGLAYQGSGNGGILHIESSSMPGSGQLHLTGQLGSVITESAQLAFAWIKSHAYELGIAPKATLGTAKELSPFRDIDIHVHLPSGGVKKDGPSAGVAMVVAIVSLMRGIKVNHGVAMTGEITLRGNVTPVGGIKEKVLGAHRAGIRTLLLPFKNEKDVTADLPVSIREEMTIIYVHSIWEALEGAFGGQLWDGESGRSRGHGQSVESRL